MASQSPMPESPTLPMDRESPRATRRVIFFYTSGSRNAKEKKMNCATLVNAKPSVPGSVHILQTVDSAENDWEDCMEIPIFMKVREM